MGWNWDVSWSLIISDRVSEGEGQMYFFGIFWNLFFEVLMNDRTS